jgi:ABC-type polysaccharide/polyol phosphate transport system ATPase subunit
VGRNGAGKTTLLGILGNVIEPTEGHVERFGRIAVLLEIGSGFNPNFTGRENATLFCSIMGLSRHESDARMESIREFSELGKYFDMPIRTYSSGMQSRLGFSCAIHVQADLIIIDETLAVGDIGFRVKCYSKIKSMQERGQTFLLVSHSPNLVANFCTRTIVLEGGEKVFDGSPLGGLVCYKNIRENLDHARSSVALAPSVEGEVNKPLWFDGFEFDRFDDADGIEICTLTGVLHAGIDCDQPALSFGVCNQEGIVICTLDTRRGNKPLPKMGAGSAVRVTMSFENRLLPGNYFVRVKTVRIVGDVAVTSSIYHNAARLEVVDDRASAGMVDLSLAISTSPLS